MERERQRDSVTDRGRVTKPIGCWDRACGKRGDEGGQEAGVGVYSGDLLESNKTNCTSPEAQSFQGSRMLASVDWSQIPAGDPVLLSFHTEREKLNLNTGSASHLSPRCLWTLSPVRNNNSL